MGIVLVGDGLMIWDGKGEVDDGKVLVYVGVMPLFRFPRVLTSSKPLQ